MLKFHIKVQSIEKNNEFSTDDVTVAICPGIGNTSESVYIRTYVHYSQRHGYRCAVLNHIGALNSVPVTGTRIFSYGMYYKYYYFILILFYMLNDLLSNVNRK